MVSGMSPCRSRLVFVKFLAPSFGTFACPFFIAIRSQLSGLIVFSREVSLVVRRPNGRNVLAKSFCGGTEGQSESQPSVQRDLTAAKHFLRLACDSNPPRRQCGVERNCFFIHA